MSASPAHLTLKPESCDRCGLCVRTCPQAILKVGGGYIYVDTSACTGCMSCADVCTTGAITRRSIPERPTASSLRPSEVPKVVVGSRAEAKALRRAADDAEKARTAHAKASIHQAKAIATATERSSLLERDGLPVWTLRDAAIMVAVMVLLIAMKNLALGSQAMQVMPAHAQIGARAFVLGAFYLGGLLALVGLSRQHAMTLPRAFGLGRLGRSWSHRFVSAGLVIAMFVLARAIALLWGAMAQAVGWNPTRSAELTTVFGAGGAGLVLSIVMVAVVGPVIEEMVFRGILQRAAGERWGMWPAILGAALLFSLAHGTAWVIVPTFVMGTAAGWLAWSRCSLWPAIALHVLYNGSAIAAAFFVAR